MANSDSKQRFTAGFGAVKTRVMAAVEWWKASRPGRALSHYSRSRGGLLCGGIAYFAMFSMFAGLTIGYTVFMAVLGDNDKLRASVLDTLSKVLPGLIKTGDSAGIIDPESLILSTGMSVAGAIAALVLLFSAISCMSAIRGAVRIMFSLPRASGVAAKLKLRELAGFVGVALAVLLSAVAGIVVASANHWLLDPLGIAGASRIILPIAAILVSAAIDVGLFFLIVRLMAGVHAPRNKLMQGAILMAVAMAIVRFLGTGVVARAPGNNALLASFAVLVTLLIWINLFAKILLMSSAFAADPPEVETSVKKA